MNKEEIAKIIREAFEEGYHSYSTPAAAYNTVEDAWQCSDAKIIHDDILK